MNQLLVSYRRYPRGKIDYSTSFVIVVITWHLVARMSWEITILSVFIYLSTVQIQMKHNAAWGKASETVTEHTKQYTR